MASPSELFSVKTRICVKEESRYGQGRGIKSREQFRKYIRNVINIVVRTRNGSGHGKRYSLAVRDIYGIGRLPFLASLIATALPTTKGGGVTAVQFHAGHVQERPVTVQSELNQFAQEPLAQIQATGNQGNINTQESLAQLGEVSETLSTIYQHDINQIEEIFKQSAVVRTNWASHVILRYSLAVGDIYGIGRFPFLASLYRYFKSQGDVII